jgi:hypothetical protein
MKGEIIPYVQDRVALASLDCVRVLLGVGAGDRELLGVGVSDRGSCKSTATNDDAVDISKDGEKVSFAFPIS